MTLWVIAPTGRSVPAGGPAGKFAKEKKEESQNEETGK